MAWQVRPTKLGLLSHGFSAQAACQARKSGPSPSHRSSPRPNSPAQESLSEGFAQTSALSRGCSGEEQGRELWVGDARWQPMGRRCRVTFSERDVAEEAWWPAPHLRGGA